MSDDFAELHVKVRHRNRPPKPYKWEIYRENDPICIKRAMHGYPYPAGGVVHRVSADKRAPYVAVPDPSENAKDAFLKPYDTVEIAV